jgi:hypothetical protein
VATLARRSVLNKGEKLLTRAHRRTAFELGQDRGNVNELAERHSSLIREPCQQPPRGWNVGLGLAL